MQDYAISSTGIFGKDSEFGKIAERTDYFTQTFLECHPRGASKLLGGDIN